MGIATKWRMRITQQQRTALFVGAAAAGALMAARAWRRRHAYDFAGKSVVITGGSRGLGLVMARALAGEGARLTLIARDQDALTRAADDIRDRQPFADVLTIAADVRQQQDVERAIAQVVERFGRVDVLINNAGIIQAGPVDHMTMDDYQNAMNTHFWGPLYATLAALPHMRERGEGRIVNISSIGGRISVPHLVPYSASKFALVGLSDGLRAELARDNIIVTTVCPGLMRTGSPENAMFKGQHAKEYSWFAISDSLPLASIDADRAGRQIVEACRPISPISSSSTSIPGCWRAAARPGPSPTGCAGSSRSCCSPSHWNGPLSSPMPSKPTAPKRRCSTSGSRSCRSGPWNGPMAAPD
jgi:NAD(P)-dependent dehydrogenase (short-subunit alcohol dehydrogenase family)